MIKRIGLLFLSITTILSVGVSFADIVSPLTHHPNTHHVERCIKITNPHGIPGYKLIVRRDEFDFDEIHYSVYSVEEDKCLPQFPEGGSSRSSNFPYLVDEKIDISTLDNLPSEEFEDKLGKYYKFDEIYPNGGSVSDLNPRTTETLVYKIVKDGDNYKLEILRSVGGVDLDSDILIKFGIAWILTILIETIVLFTIAKLFRKKNQTSNKRLILIGILASTITLPLLRFVLPLFIEDGVEYMVIGELLVTLIEIFIIKYGLKISRWKAIIASVASNLCSFLIGLITF